MKSTRMKYLLLIVLMAGCQSQKPIKVTPTYYPPLLYEKHIKDTVWLEVREMCFVKIAGRTFQVERSGKWIREVLPYDTAQYRLPITRIFALALKDDPFYNIKNGRPIQSHTMTLYDQIKNNLPKTKKDWIALLVITICFLGILYLGWAHNQARLRKLQINPYKYNEKIIKNPVVPSYGRSRI